MKAAVMEGVRKPLVVRDMPDPQCPPNGAILKTAAEGICRSDWHLWSGDWTWVGLAPAMPMIMGHEFCGVVQEVGKEVKDFKKGERVLVPFSQGDGTCELCRSGNSNICNTPLIPGVTYHGGYGSYVGIPFADLNLVHMPDAVGFLEGASLGCRFMTSYHGIVDRAQVRPGEWVAVHGCGGIGLAAIQIASSIGANVIAVDLDGRKLELAKEVGASHIVNAKAGDPAAAIVDITKGGAHVSVDALGVAATCRNSINSLRKQGRHLQIGLTTQAEKGEISVPIDKIVLMELQMLGTLGMQSTRYPGMLQMVEAKKLNPKAMITGTVGLDGASAILEEMTNFQNVGVTIIDYKI
jgi:D-arabinose 1-dehydrogenase-like Zn-dependent alcohol dehydrogenase